MGRPKTAARYDPPVNLEGENMGLVEAFAERLWRKRTGYYNSRSSWDRQSGQVKVAWRSAAEEMLKFLFDIGFTGPAGLPAQDRFNKLTYCWNYMANEWEIIDSEGGYVALVRESPDLEMMLAAPAMRKAINDLLGSIPVNHPSRDLPEMVALACSLPETQDHNG